MANYLNGVFSNRRQGKFGEEINISLTEEGLKSLQDLPKNDKGYRNFTLTPQKADNDKFSAKPGYQKKEGAESPLPF